MDLRLILRAHYLGYKASAAEVASFTAFEKGCDFCGLLPFCNSSSKPHLRRVVVISGKDMVPEELALPLGVADRVSDAGLSQTFFSRSSRRLALTNAGCANLRCLIWLLFLFFFFYFF